MIALYGKAQSPTNIIGKYIIDSVVDKGRLIYSNEKGYVYGESNQSLPNDSLSKKHKEELFDYLNSLYSEQILTIYNDSSFLLLYLGEKFKGKVLFIDDNVIWLQYDKNPGFDFSLIPFEYYTRDDKVKLKSIWTRQIIFTKE